jgi:hypothetical protein
MLDHVRFDQIRRLNLVSGEQSLVVRDVRGHDRGGRHESGDELKARNVFAEDDQADRQRRRHHEAQWSPQPGPERDGNQQAHLGHAGGSGVEERFQTETREQLKRDEHGDHESWPHPAIEHRQTHKYWRQSADQRADVGDESHHGGEDSPQHGVRYADEEQSYAHADAKAQIDERLHQQVTADPFSRLVESAGRPRQVSVTEDAHDAVSQVLTLEKHEDDKNRDEPASGEMGKKGIGGADPRSGRRLRSHDHRRTGGARRGCVLVDLLLNVVDRRL